MWKSTVPKGSKYRGGNRSSLVATAVLAALLSLGFAAGTAFGQDEQAPPSRRRSSPTSNLRRAWEGIWATVTCRRWTINSST